MKRNPIFLLLCNSAGSLRNELRINWLKNFSGDSNGQPRRTKHVDQHDPETITATSVGTDGKTTSDSIGLTANLDQRLDPPHHAVARRAASADPFLQLPWHPVRPLVQSSRLLQQFQRRSPPAPSEMSDLYSGD